VIVVSNSSPLITLARIGHLELLWRRFGRIHIGWEVYEEVVVRGSGRPAATSVGGADWIETHPPAEPNELASLRSNHALGIGELPLSSWRASSRLIWPSLTSAPRVAWGSRKAW
jgi:predicted nucleic acid-binding protein